MSDDRVPGRAKVTTGDESVQAQTAWLPDDVAIVTVPGRVGRALVPLVQVPMAGFTASVLMYDANGAPFYETERVQVEPGAIWTVRFTDEALRLTLGES